MSVATPSDRVNFHLPMSVVQREALRSLARAQGRAATELARELVQEGIARLLREQRNAAVRAFAETVAGSQLDLDPELEAAAAQVLGEEAP